MMHSALARLCNYLAQAPVHPQDFMTLLPWLKGGDRTNEAGMGQLTLEPGVEVGESLAGCAFLQGP